MLEIFNIQPDYDLNIMHQNQTLADITTRVLTDLTKIIHEEKPDLVLVHGDTTTSFAASLASFMSKRRWATWKLACGLGISIRPSLKR